MGRRKNMLALMVVLYVFQEVCLTECVNLGLVYLEDDQSSSTVVMETDNYFKDTRMLSQYDIHIHLVKLQIQDLNYIIDTACDALQNNTIAFLLVGTCSVLRNLELAVAHLGAPVIGVHLDRCPEKLGSVFRVQPSPLYSGHAVRSLLLEGDFTQASLLVDSSVSSHDLRHLQSILSRDFLETSVTYVSEDLSRATIRIRAWLDSVSSWDSIHTCVVMFLRPGTLDTVADQVSRSGSLLEDYPAIVVPTGDDVTAGEVKGLAVFRETFLVSQTQYTQNISTDSQYMARGVKHVREGLLALGEAVRAMSTTSMASDTTSPSCRNRNISGTSPTWQLTEQLRQIKTNTTTFDSDGYNANSVYHVRELCFHDDQTSSKPVAFWRENGGLKTRLRTRLFQENTKGLGNITLLVGVNQAPPFLMKMDNGTSWDGFCIDILNELASRLNFRYELIEAPDKMWGSVNEFGNWNGLVNLTMSKKVDLSIGPISLMVEREEVVDFTKPYMEDGAGIILRKFEDQGSKIFRTFKPFSEGVWLTIAGAVLLVGFSLALVNKLSPGRNRPQQEEGVEGDSSGTRHKQITTFDNIWIVYGSYMEQGAEVTPPNISGRFILGFWWIFTIVMVSSYTANLAAFLTVSFTAKPIRNVDDLAAQTRIKPLVKQGSNLYTLLKKGETATFRTLYSMLLSSPTVTTNDEALELVLTGGYAFLTDQLQIEFLRKADCNNLMVAETPFNVGGLGFIVPESSPLLEILSVNLIKLQEAGLVGKWRQERWSSGETCAATTNVASSVQSLELDSTSGPFLVFAGSTVLAVVCLVLECVCSKFSGKGRVCLPSRDGNRELDETTETD